MMTATQLQPPTLPQISERVAKDAGEAEANFLALRLLNKRARVRLSPEQLDLDPLPGQARLFAVANSGGCFAAVARDSNSTWYITSAPLSQLRSTFTSSTQSSEITFAAQSKHPIPTPASFIAYALNESRIVIALADGSLAVYDAQSLLGNTPVNPLHVFPGSPGATFRKLAPNPGDMAELVAVLRDVGDRTDVVAVEIYDVQNMRSICGWRAGTTRSTKPTAFSWSAKGKLLALGLASGDIEAFSPTAPSTVKTVVPKVQGLSEGTIISTTWMSNTEFYSVYTPPGPPSPDAEHTHYVTEFNPKANLFVEVKVNPPALPFPGLRASNQFIVLFRSWDTARILAFVGDSASSDIGVLAAIGEIGTTLHNHWTNLSLEETSQPTVPLDKDMNDTVLVGLECDLTGTEPFRFTTASGEETDVPAPPVLYAYASDGTLVGWHVVNTNGVAYPGMVTPAPVTAPAPAPSGGGMDAEPTPTTAARPAGAMQAPAMEISTSFGAASPAVASPMAATPSGGATASGFGFGGFAGGASKFGQSGFGAFNSGNTGNAAASAPALASPMPSQRPPSPEEAAMDSDNDAGSGAGFGGLSLGDSSDDASKNKTSSVFGSFGAPSASGTQPSSAFGGSSGGAFSGLKPATGFGAFGGQSTGGFGASSAFSNTSTSTSSPSSGGAFGGLKSTSGFGTFGGQGSGAFGGSAFGQTSTPGQSAFGQTSTPGQSAFGQTSTLGQSASNQTSTPGQSAFGQSSFGQPAFGQSAFGKSALGQSGFGQPAAGATHPTPAPGGGFGAFAQAGPTGFGASLSKQDSKPAWAVANDDKSPNATETSKQTPLAFGQSSFGQPAASASQSSVTPGVGFGAFAQTGTSAFATNQPKADAKPAWASTTDNNSSATPEAPKAETKPAAPTFGQTSFGQPAFGQSAFSQATSAFGAANKPSTPATSAFGAFSQAGTSAFGSTTANADAKPASTAKKEDAPTTPREETKSAFAPPTPPSAPATPTRVQPKPTMKPKQTPPRSASRSSSPSSTAVSSPSDSDSDDDAPGATTPQATTPQATAPSAESPVKPMGGAFSQLKTSAYGFGKVDSGFGAFGGAVSNTSSPFFKAAAKPIETPRTPAFAAGTSAFGASTSTPIAAGSTTPAFGTPSALGSKSVFGTSSPAPAAGSSTPVFGAPSAFGAKSVFGQPTSPNAKSVTTTTPVTTPPSGGFAAFSNTKSPFGAASGGGKSFSEMLRDKSGQVLIAPAHTPKTPDAKPISAFANLPKLSDTGKDKKAASGDDDDDALSFGDEDDDSADFLSESEEESDIDDDEQAGDADKTAHVEEEDEDDDDEEEEEEEEEDEEEDEDEGGTHTANAAKAKTDSESAKLPSLLSRLGPAVTAEQKSAPTTGTKREGSTTPPGSPLATKSTSTPPAKQASLVPPPLVSVTGPAVGGARGTTRPIRSSPLASKPITGDDSGSDSGQSPPATPPSNAKGKQRAEPGTQETRPKTPPLLSTIKTSTAPATLPFSLVSPAKPGESTSSKTVSLTPPQTLPPFTFSKPGTSTPATTIPTIAPPKPGAFTLAPSPSTPTAKPVGLSTTPSMPTGTPAAGQSTTPKGTPPVLIHRPTLVPPIPVDEFPEIKDMQAECEFLVTYLAGEFTKLLPLTQLAAKRRVEMYKTGLNMTDIHNAEGWRISDLPRIEQLMRVAESDLAEVKQLFQSYMSAITDIESQLLKANTRKEEIIRFDKASKDPEFARMLKARTLGPEHLEAQSQLRREIRAVRERLQQLEGYMQEAKKKLSHIKSGKAAVRPPSLALINGTCNHLEEAIEQNEDVVEKLSKRAAHLSLELAPRRPKWDQRTANDDTKQRAEATPNFAVSTAAALNAEMSANKLKRALLAARKEPMLNTEAARKMPVAQDYVLPGKEEPATPPALTFKERLDDSFSPGDDYSPHAQRRAKNAKLHQPPIHLKKSASPTPPAAPTFNWGPLPSIAPPAPPKALPFDLKKGTSPASTSSSAPSLSASWVTEGFNIKKEES